MMKKNKLHTVNRWNQPALMVDRQRHNIFDGFTFGQSNQMNSSPFGITLNAPTIAPYVDWSNPIQRAKALGEAKFMTNNFANQAQGIIGASANQQMQNFASKENAVSNPFSFKDAFSKQGLKNGLKAGAGAAIGGIASAVGQIGGNLISGGLESGAGSAISSIGGTIGGAVGAVNPVLGAAVSVGSQLLGGLTNAIIGSKINTKNVNKVISNNNNLVQAGKDLAKSTSTSSLLNNAQSLGSGMSFSNKFIGKDGWFSNKAEKKADQLRRAQKRAVAFQDAGLATGVRNVDANTDDAALGNTLAVGGPLFNSIEGALDYGFVSDYIASKRQENAIKNKMAGLSQMPVFMPRGFAFGGNTQTNGADFPTGLVHIQAGGSHESNPNDGVQLGVDQNNVPNLVEEGETVYDDYVYSNRILADEATKKLFHLPKKRDISYADISKRLEKEVKERPNDPISQKGLEAQMHKLAEQQERQKQEMEAKRAKAAFDALSPEEQTAIMQQRAVQEQAAIEQQAMAEQQAMQEQAMAEQQQEYNIGQEPPQFCKGGHLFANGGKAYNKMLNSLGFHTQKEFDDWAKENGIDFGDTWKDNPNTLDNDILSKLWKNEKFKEALRKNNPALAHAFETKGYDFGAFEPTAGDKATIQSISKGNWKATDGQGWLGSEDLAFKQATKGLSDGEIKALSTEQLADRMSQTNAYKNTSEWLKNGDNALLYLNTLLNDPDTPEVAKKHALQFVKDGKWKDGYNYSYDDVFGKVRATNPGTYWHTAMEANRGNQAANFVINDDGSVEQIVGDVPKDWKAAGNYNWADEGNDYTYNYYKRPTVSSITPEPEKAEEAAENLAPKRSWEGLRYAGLFGPAVGLGMMAAGIGKPDTASIDAAVEGAGDVRFADYKPIGNYLTYHPLDIWYEQNRLNANARATDRAILNSGANQGSKMAGLLAAGYNDQIASGNLFRQEQEYNDALKEKVANFNRGTDQFNSEQYGATSRFNAGAWNDANRAARQLRLQAASQKADMDAGWYNSLYGNVSGLFKGLGDLGTENKRDNMINWMLSKGIFGTVDPNDPEMKKRVKVVKKSV